MRVHRIVVFASIMAQGIAIGACASGPAKTAQVAGTAAAEGAVAATASSSLGRINPSLRDEREVHLADIVQLTDGGENAEAYWSFAGDELIFQTTRAPFGCDQIMRMPADGSTAPKLVSTGKGRTTCAYFLPGDGDIVYSSTHATSSECPAPPDRSQGYVWALYDSYEIYRARADGSELVNLSNRDGYDAEATVCATDGSIIFTSDRDGDLELYRMDADGGNVVRLTKEPGYDGGAFFSPDCSQIVWRASRPQGAALDDYRRLLAQDLIRPSKLEIFVANADGSNVRQVTYLDTASFAPYFHPSGKSVLFSTNYGDPKGREFNIWSINVDGTGMKQITFSEGFDGFPMFSPDGTRLAFASNRNQSKPGETNVFVARWVEDVPQSASAPADAAAKLPAKVAAADRIMDDVRWLADDARGGRGIGTPGLDQSADWLAAQLKDIGAEGAGDDRGGYKQPFEVTVALSSGSDTALVIDGKSVDAAAFTPTWFSAQTAKRRVQGQTVFVDYGIVASELGIDDYRGKAVRGKIVVARRFLPDDDRIKDDRDKRRYSDLQYKAFVARERGARGLIVVDVPVSSGASSQASGTEADAPLPKLEPMGAGDVGIPVMVVTREAGGKLVQGRHRVSMAVALERKRAAVYNVVGKIAAGSADRLPGSIVVGAHYDHLGMGGSGSLEVAQEVIHNGADDNASGTAALLEVARQLVAQQRELRRDVYVVGFSAEESGVIGSRYFTEQPPPGLDLKQTLAMFNMDMVGRMRGNRLMVRATKTASEWEGLVAPICDEMRIRCAMGGDGYGPSDHMPFYTSGLPVLYVSTGVHTDYHRGSDDAEYINAAGAARAAELVAGIAAITANREQKLSFQRAPMPERRGDVRQRGGSLGTIPAYGEEEEGQPGVLLSDVRAGGPAEVAGVRGRDRLVKIGDTEIRNIRDLLFVLRQASPGEETVITVIREGKRMQFKAVFGAPSRRVSR